MAVEVSNAPLKGKLVIVNLGLVLSGDLDAPILDADAIVAIDGRIAAIGKARDLDLSNAAITIDAKGSIEEVAARLDAALAPFLAART